MIKLYQFTNKENKADSSPFCIKVEMFMKVNAIEHCRVVGNVQKAPKKKLPYITNGNDIISDSEQILKYLAKKYNIDMDKDLSMQEKATSYSMRKMMDEYFYFILVYARWIDEEGWKKTSQFFANMPLPLRLFLPKLIRSSIRKMLHGQGMGRHSRQDIIIFANEALESISSFLEENAFFIGKNISSLDITIYSYLTAIVNHYSFITEEFKKYQNLIEYEKRLTVLYYNKN